MSGQVLIFEGDPGFASELRDEFASLGFAVRVVDEGATGFQAALTLRPDLILVSVELPKGNGFSVCNKFKRDPAFKDVPLVMMSSDPSEVTFEEHKKLKNMRAQAYVHKPVSFGDLLKSIAPFLPKGSVAQQASLRPPAPDDDILVSSVVEEESGDLPDESFAPPVAAPVAAVSTSEPVRRVSMPPRPVPSARPSESSLKSEPASETISAKSSMVPTALAVSHGGARASWSPAPVVARESALPPKASGGGVSVAEQEVRVLRDMLARKEREVVTLREKLAEVSAQLEELRNEPKGNVTKDKLPMVSLERAKNALIIATVAMDELHQEMSKYKS